MVKGDLYQPDYCVGKGYSSFYFMTPFLDINLLAGINFFTIFKNT